MRINALGTVFLLSILALGCSSTDRAQRAAIQAESTSIPLQATQRNAGEIGRVDMRPDGEKTRMTIFISGVPNTVSRPVDLYTFIFSGTCSKLAPVPTYSMNENVLASFGSTTGGSAPFSMPKVVPAPVARLLSEGYAIVVQTSPADGGYNIFCGELK